MYTVYLTIDDYKVYTLYLTIGDYKVFTVYLTIGDYMCDYSTPSPPHLIFEYASFVFTQQIGCIWLNSFWVRINWLNDFLKEYVPTLPTVDAKVTFSLFLKMN